ncbi:MAG: acetylornithine/succinylornithine family transaminase [Oscillibacter sp.]|nr:acetylornithine/succinylornithine family transaminase [Oscillibacter sp.]
MMKTKELDTAYVAHTYNRFPVEIVSGHGSLVTDDAGREYIDMGAGIAVNIFGMNDEGWKAAVKAQLDKCQHTSNLYYTAPCAQLAELLCRKTGMKKVFFSNSGAEANECAIKAARKYAQDKKGQKYDTVVTLINSFHGRTLTTLAATGQEHYHQQFIPLTPGFVYAAANDLEGIKKLVAENKVAGILFEAVQGEGGVIPLEKAFVQGLAQLCAEQDILLMADEVQIGNGRSGALYGYMNFGVQPDIVSTAKGLGGGLPLGATLLGEKAQNVFVPGDHGSTFGGNPVCCAGAVNVMSRLDDALLQSVREKSAYIVGALSGVPGVESVTGMGLMLGIKTVKPAADVVAACRENGVLVLTAKDKVRLLPALNIPMDVLEKAVAVIAAACR